MLCRGLGHTVASLTPREAGEHQLEVLLGDIELEQSPLYFDVVASDTMDITAYGNGLMQAESGKFISMHSFASNRLLQELFLSSSSGPETAAPWRKAGSGCGCTPFTERYGTGWRRGGRGTSG